MLPLDDPRWADLTHAYGSASDIPPQLQLLKLEPASADRAFRELDCLGALNHQSSVSTALYAVVPHFVEIASSLPPERRADILGWVGVSLADAALPDAPVVPAFLKQSFEEGVAEAVRLTAETLVCSFDAETTKWLLAALAGLKGHADLSHVVSSLGGFLDCPNCGITIEPMKSTLNVGFTRRRVFGDGRGLA